MNVLLRIHCYNLNGIWAFFHVKTIIMTHHDLRGHQQFDLQ